MIHHCPLVILGLSLIPPVGCGYSFGPSGLARQAKSVLLGGRYKGLQHQTQQNNITFCPSPPIYTCPLRTKEAKFTSTTPRFGARYEASDKGSVYATYSKGFKAGGFNPYSCNNPFDRLSNGAPPSFSRSTATILYCGSHDPMVSREPLQVIAPETALVKHHD